MSEAVPPPVPPAAGAGSSAAASPPVRTAVTDNKDDHPFFRYYGLLPHQQNMLQDSVRTGTYQSAIHQNPSNFKDKVVLDVGTGTGILAHFAIQAGAKHVYAVEASDMADAAKKLMAANGLADKVTIIKGKVEEVELPEKVDVIISEPMGFMLVHERMLESYIAARERFLKPGGLMMPSKGTIYIAPFCDHGLYHEQLSKTRFWSDTTDFYGLDLTCLAPNSKGDHFSQPVVGYFDPAILLTHETVTHVIDFGKDSVDSLAEIVMPFSFKVARTELLHGIASWFDVEFLGSDNPITLSTAPTSPGTHWYQCRLLLQDPLAVNAGQTVTGSVSMRVNSKFSYDIAVTVRLEGTDIVSTNSLNLHDQMYHYLGGGASATPATATDGAYGTYTASGTYGY